MNKTTILLLNKKQVTSDLFEYELKLDNNNGKISYISIIAKNNSDFRQYLSDLQHVLVDTDACMAFDDNNILSGVNHEQ